MMVKGKVTNGVIEVIAVVEGRVVGYRKPLHSKAPAETFETKQVEAHEVPRDIRKAAMQGKVTPLVELLQKEEPIDIPDFMKERTKRMQAEKRKARMFKRIK